MAANSQDASKTVQSGAADRLSWFRQARFGMMIHWGLYSILGRGTWMTLADALTPDEMRNLASRFTPREFDPRHWAEVARAAGARYVVLTTRHHDGFCLFDSDVSDFTTTKTAAGRDFVAEYVEAVRVAGLKVGLYYSLLDWRYPGYFDPDQHPESARAAVQQVHDQVRELLTKYGKIDLMWFDGAWPASLDFSDETMSRQASFWRSRELLDMIWDLQPHCVVNNRSGLPGDYDTPEQTLPVFAGDRHWEICQTIGDWDQSWSDQRYTPDPVRKTADQLILQLAIVMKNNGNMLLNVAPDCEGRIPEAEERVMREIGMWVSENAEAFYDTARPDMWGSSMGDWVFRRSTGYFVFRSWPGVSHSIHRLGGVTPRSACMLAGGRPVDFRWDAEAGTLHLLNLPERPPNRAVSIVKVEFEGSPFMKDIGRPMVDERLA